METDAEVNMTNFKSALVPLLDQGKLPPSLAKAFADAGYSVPADTKVAAERDRDRPPTVKWLLKDADGQDYVLRLEPQFWEADFKGSIRFIKTLDHFWIYR